jgi:predicted amidophosphoribosyltransferase
MVKKIKHDFEADLVPFMARVASDFMLLSPARWRDTDVLVPVPPSPEKFGKRGFAPTDLITRELSSMLGIPWRAALVRRAGPSTRDASYDELAAEFSVDGHNRADLKGARLLLVEDVVTTGKTVSICIKKLRPRHEAVAARSRLLT